MDRMLSLSDQADIALCVRALEKSLGKSCYVGKRISKNAASALILSDVNVTRLLFITRLKEDK